MADTVTTEKLTDEALRLRDDLEIWITDRLSRLDALLAGSDITSRDVGLIFAIVLCVCLVIIGLIGAMQSQLNIRTQNLYRATISSSLVYIVIITIPDLTGITISNQPIGFTPEALNNYLGLIGLLCVFSGTGYWLALLNEAFYPSRSRPQPSNSTSSEKKTQSSDNVLETLFAGTLAAAVLLIPVLIPRFLAAAGNILKYGVLPAGLVFAVTRHSIDDSLRIALTIYAWTASQIDGALSSDSMQGIVDLIDRILRAVQN